MKLTYIQHSSVLLETENEYLLFDYYASAPLPELKREKPIYVFASHSHPDHFSVNIFALKTSMDSVKFILSSDIPDRLIPDACLKDTLIVSPYDNIEVGALRVETLQSTDLGVAFVVTVEGKTIYHSGDLNCWVWAGSPDYQNNIMERQYIDEVKQLADRELFLSFVPLDPRQDDDFDRGMMIFVENVKSRYICPIHMWSDFKVLDRFCEKHPEIELIKVTADGEEFEI